MLTIIIGWIFFCVLMKKSCENIWWVSEKLLPLHPQTRERPFFRGAVTLSAQWLRSLKDLHRQNEVVQEATASCGFWIFSFGFSVFRGRWVEETNRHLYDSRDVLSVFSFFCLIQFEYRLSWIRFRQSSPRIFSVCVSQIHFLQWRVWSWLRMNASYRLNTCKSRGSMVLAC